jgi:hypothetical protein
MSLLKKAPLFVLILVSAFASSQSIPAADAAKHLGQRGTVCGTIAETHTATTSAGTPTFIDFENAYPNQVFTAVVWQADRSKVGSTPKSGTLCVTGQITSYKGKPQIALRSRSDWSASAPSLSNDNHYTNSNGNVVHSPAYSSGGAPAGATAQCADGTYSFSQHRQGTCSHHGGVSRWL